MIIGRRSLMALFALLLLYTSVGLSGPTAKSALKEATAVAKKWKHDAVLVSLASLVVKNDGSAPSWLHTFYSSSAKKSLIVTAKGKALEELEVDRSAFTQPVSGDFLDSDKAMSEAKKHGLKGSSPSMGLNVMGTGASATLCWSVNGGFDKGDVSITLNGRTGAFIKRDVMAGF